ncbi:MAG: AAA family ATPase, partial [Clostridiales bacterium]|nr:AAA family ATPase [Clostridiales bacterium]
MKISQQAELLRENGLDTLFAPTVENSNETGITCLDDVEALKTSWLEYPYIPRGKITGLLGDPGNGKTWLGLRWAADVSAGRPLFGGESDMREPENVIYQSSEDGLADTIKPRLVRMQPDFKRIFIIDESQTGLTLSDTRLENALQKI